MVKLLLVLMCVGQVLVADNTYAENNLCVPQGYTFGFFNGVWNTVEQAHEGLDKFKLIYGTTLNGEPINYEVFYNQTGSKAGTTGMQDIAEVFMQRATEIDNTGEYGKRWEYFWEAFTGERKLTDKILNFFPSAANLIANLYSDVTSKIIAGWSYLLSNPPTEADYARHNARLDTLSSQGQKMMLVAHSQGNLFVNHAYDYIVPKVDSGSVAVVHIAPASPTLRGYYVLVDIDLVINGLRVQGFNTVPPINLTIPTSSADVSGHTLVNTYLDPTRAARAKVISLIDLMMKNLNTPRAANSLGSFTVTLTWDGIGEIDLHVFEPSGAHVYPYYSIGDVGHIISLANLFDYGPEIYYAACDLLGIQGGIYRIGINNYSALAERIATIQVATSKKGIIYTKTMGVGPALGEAGNSSPIPVMNLLVAKDAKTGALTFSSNE